MILYVLYLTKWFTMTLKFINFERFEILVNTTSSNI